MNTENKLTQKPLVLQAHTYFVISRVIVKSLKLLTIMSQDIPVSRAPSPKLLTSPQMPIPHPLWLLSASSFLHHLAGAPSSKAATFSDLPLLVLGVSCHHTLPWFNQWLGLVHKFGGVLFQYSAYLLIIIDLFWGMNSKLFELLPQSKERNYSVRYQNNLNSSVCAHLSQPRLLLGQVFYCQFLHHCWIWARKYSA